MENFILNYHFIISIILGYLLDIVIGDPKGLYHFVQFEGFLISTFERLLNRYPKQKIYSYMMGTILWIISVGISFLIIWKLIHISYNVNYILGFIIESFFVFQCLATHSLRKESMHVYYSLEKGNIDEARVNLSYIVGRDTINLNEDSIIKADVETIAENTSDGVISPLFYIAFFGVYGGIFCKLVNTLDSMVGYKNDRFKYFGTFSAKMDDIIQFIPARLTAILLIISSFILRYNTINAIKIFKRDRFKHASMNSAQSESVVAGALDIQLAGDAVYSGVVKSKPFIGNPNKKIEMQDIIKANKMLYLSSICFFVLIIIILYLVRFV